MAALYRVTVKRALGLAGVASLLVIASAGGAPAAPPPVASLAVGYYHTCALLPDSVVKCWGSNEYGQLGDGTTKARRSAVRATQLPGSIRSLTAGAQHTCALTSDARVLCWGWNDSGQLGNGTTGERQPPQAVAGLSNVVAVGAGGLHTCALVEGGAVKCWGDNRFGQLGDGTTANSSVPVAVSGLTSGTQAIAIGGLHTCALAAGAVKCWGDNQFGELGDGTTINRRVPVAVKLPRAARAIAAGVAHTCALLEDGKMRCWGNNEAGQLGNGDEDVAVVKTPVAVHGLPAGVTQMAAGFADTCALTEAGAVYCWGKLFEPTLEQVETLSRGVVGIALAGGDTYDDHACAAMASGGAKCWGANDDGQLGNGFTELLHFKPATVLGLADGVQVLTIIVSGHGIVTGSGLRCHDKCGYERASGSTVKLSARPSLGWAFGRWGGACSGRGKTCTVSLTASGLVAAHFTKRK